MCCACEVKPLNHNLTSSFQLFIVRECDLLLLVRNLCDLDYPEFSTFIILVILSSNRRLANKVDNQTGTNANR